MKIDITNEREYRDEERFAKRRIYITFAILRPAICDLRATCVRPACDLRATCVRPVCDLRTMNGDP